MSLAPKFNPSHIYKAASSAVSTNVHHIQLFLDYDCPFSAILFLKFYKEVIPKTEALYPGKFEFVFYNMPQPWHPTSSLMHEVSLAVAAVAPSKFWDYSKILFENQSNFFDTETYNETRKGTYQRLIELAAPLGIDAAELWKLVEIKGADSPSNAGNSIAKDFKYFIRLHRTIGVHVTPTLAINGILNTSLESSSPVEDFLKVFSQQLE